MESSLIVLLIWLVIAFVGVVAKVNKKGQTQSNHGNSTASRMTIDNIYESIQQEKSSNGQTCGKRDNASQKATVVEGERTTSTPETATADAAPENKDSVDLDFDPVKMVVYSEIMTPGYEKY